MQAHVGGRDRGGERAAGAEIGHEHGLLGIEQLRGLGHEVDAGQDDHPGIGAHRLARERQAVAGDVGDAVENLRRLVIVREDDGVALAFSARIASMSSANAPHSAGGINRATRS